ncbi:MAG TPA: hypothetical protein VMA31_15480 [Bryobacteraceae bacterium]|nr:hypothetical protein [Bryobacteraceae bacterium]
MDLNLDTLKREILEYLAAAGFAVFRGTPGGLEGLPMLLWDSENYPDYQMFLEVAQKAGVKIIVFASRELASTDIDELLEQLEECSLDRDEQRDYQSRLRALRKFEGVTCSIELAFDHDSRLHVYEAQPDWYGEFLELEEEIGMHLSGEDLDSGDSLGGYFSKN